jgi:hypothetical protein
MRLAADLPHTFAWTGAGQTSRIRHHPSSYSLDLRSELEEACKIETLLKQPGYEESDLGGHTGAVRDDNTPSLSRKCLLKRPLEQIKEASC